MPIPNHCVECDKPIINDLICSKCKEKEDNTEICGGCGEVYSVCYCNKEKEMSITGMLAIGNGEKCPFCEIIMEEDTDSLGHMIENHKEQLNEVLYGKD